MFGKSVSILSTLVFLLLASSFVLPAQNSGRNVLDRVYTEDQAERGAVQFEANCSECHTGNDPDGPTLLSDFIERWREGDLDSLFTFIKTTMPRDAPGKLTESAYVDILSYILQMNVYPAGMTELTAADLAGIQLVGRNGPQPLPNNTLVRTAGCLVQQGTDSWTLINAPAPSRIRRVEESPAQDLKTAAAQAAGIQTFRLQNVVNPESHKGHRVQVKGVLSRQTGAERINVLLLEMLSPAC